jgi:hypothetical protein
MFENFLNFNKSAEGKGGSSPESSIQNKLRSVAGPTLTAVILTFLASCESNKINTQVLEDFKDNKEWVNEDTEASYVQPESFILSDDDFQSIGKVPESLDKLTKLHDVEFVKWGDAPKTLDGSHENVPSNTGKTFKAEARMDRVSSNPDDLSIFWEVSNTDTLDTGEIIYDSRKIFRTAIGSDGSMLAYTRETKDENNKIECVHALIDKKTGVITSMGLTDDWTEAAQEYHAKAYLTGHEGQVVLKRLVFMRPSAIQEGVQVDIQSEEIKRGVSETLSVLDKVMY